MFLVTVHTHKTLFICFNALFMSHEQRKKCWSKKKEEEENADMKRVKRQSKRSLSQNYN